MAMGRGRNGFELQHVTAGGGFALTVHRDSYTGDDNPLDLRSCCTCASRADGWPRCGIAFEEAGNDRYSGVQAATLAPRLTTVDPDRPRPPSSTPHRWASPSTVRRGQNRMA